MDSKYFALGYQIGVDSVPTAPPVETQEKEITVTENGTTEVTPDEGKLLAKVTVNTEVSGGGGGGGGGAELNIAYGDTAPEDTSKLWVKTSEPSGVVVSMEGYSESAGNTLEMLETVMPEPRKEAKAQAFGDKIIIVGGDVNDIKGTGSILYYDSTTQKIKYTGYSTHAYEDCHRCFIGTKIFSFTGKVMSAYHGYVSCFDLEKMAETTLPTTPALEGGFIAPVGKYVYMFYPGGDGTGKVLKYDTEEGAYEIASDSAPRPTAGVSVGTNVYYINPSKQLRCFDTVTAQYRDIYTGLPSYNAIMCVVGTKLYMIFNSTTASKVFCMDTKTEQVEQLETLDAVSVNSASAVMGTDIYLFGACKDENDVDHIRRYATVKREVSVLPDNIRIIPQIENNVFPIINTEQSVIEVGVKAVFRGDENNKGIPVKASLYKNTEWVTI